MLATAAQSWFLATEVRLVHLNRARQAVPAGSDKHRAQPVQQRPRSRVRADLEQPLQAESGDAVRLCSEHRPGGKPNRERRASAVEEHSSCDRRSRTADGTLVAAIGYDPSAGVFASRADEPLRPPQSVELVLVSCEPRLELTHGSWILEPCAKSGAGHRSRASPVG